VILSGPGRRLDPSQGPLDASRPLGIYIHFPYCGVHCPYCDFAVDARSPADIPHDRYGAAVLRELAIRGPWFGALRAGAGGAAADGALPRLRSIYFGGGTPGLWRPDVVGQVIASIERGWGVTAGALEVTLEANPGEVDQGPLAALRAVGINRLSFGAQSFDDGELERLGRNHRAAAIPAAFAAARAAGFRNVSADLMFGLPGQTEDSWRRSIAALVALEPEHVSAYALTVERGTPFGALDRAGRLPRPDDEAVAGFLRRGRQLLAEAGYQQYEISSYARPGFRAIHNHLYWTQGAYLGVGVSAASFRPLTDGSGWRFSNPRGSDGYLRALEAAAEVAAPGRPAKVERRSAGDLENEALWLALRTRDGVDRAAHAGRFGGDPLGRGDRAHQAERCRRSGWLSISDQNLRLTDDGVLFADEVAARLWVSGATRTGHREGEGA
jgi:oxygen-independent coproporphyrinogen III oxidase